MASSAMPKSIIKRVLAGYPDQKTPELHAVLRQAIAIARAEERQVILSTITIQRDMLQESLGAIRNRRKSASQENDRALIKEYNRTLQARKTLDSLLRLLTK